jgi:hypothetical protein
MQEIIQQLVANSETFQQKTEFSQAKYLKKKQRKYLQLVTVLRPCTRLIAQLFFDRSQAKIMYAVHCIPAEAVHVRQYGMLLTPAPYNAGSCGSIRWRSFWCRRTSSRGRGCLLRTRARALLSGR